MNYYSDSDPRIMPHTACACGQIDRVQDMTIDTSYNRTKQNELGRSGVLGYKVDTPSVSLSMRQFEYGVLDFFRILANQATGTTKIELTDFESAVNDIGVYCTDSSGSYLGTLWMPNMRTSSINMSIGDPNAIVERNITLVGEDSIFLQNNNKYLIFLRDTAASGAGHTITIGAGDYANYPDPVIDPDNSGSYILKIVRTRSGVLTTLTLGTDYTYSDALTKITIPASESGDTYHVWYSATTYISGSTAFTDNDSDASHLEANSVSIYLTNTSNYIYRLQSCTIDIAFDRYDIQEIGDTEVVLRGVRDTNVTATLGRTLENYAIEEYLRGVSGQSYGKIDGRNYLSNISLIVKIYTDSTKTDFIIGYKFTDMTPSGDNSSMSVKEYTQRTISLIGEAGFISTVESDFA